MNGKDLHRKRLQAQPVGESAGPSTGHQQTVISGPMADTDAATVRTTDLPQQPPQARQKTRASVWRLKYHVGSVIETDYVRRRERSIQLRLNKTDG